MTNAGMKQRSRSLARPSAGEVRSKPLSWNRRLVVMHCMDKYWAEQGKARELIWSTSFVLDKSLI